MADGEGVGAGRPYPSMCQFARAGDVAGIQRLHGAGFSIEEPDGHGMTPLMNACEGGRLEAVKALVELGADAAAVTPGQGGGALPWALASGSWDIVRWLMSERPDALFAYEAAPACAAEYASMLGQGELAADMLGAMIGARGVEAAKAAFDFHDRQSGAFHRLLSAWEARAIAPGSAPDASRLQGSQPRL